MMYCKLLAVTLLLAASCQARPRWGDARPTWGPTSGAHGSTWEMTVLEEVGPSVGQVYGIYHGNPWADVDDDQVVSSSNQWNSQHGSQSASVVNSPWGSSGHAAGNRNYPSGSTWGVSSGQHGQSDVASAWAGQGNQGGNGWASGNSWKQASRSHAWSGNGYGSNPWGGANQQTHFGRTNSWSNSADVDQPWAPTSSRMSNHGSASGWGGSSRANQAGRNNGWMGVGNSWAGSDEEDQSVQADNHGVNQAGSRSWGQDNTHQGGNQGSQGNQGNHGSNWSWGLGQNNQGVSQVGSRSWGQGQASQGAHQGSNQVGQHGGNQNGNQGPQGHRGHQAGNQASQGSRWSWGQGQNNQGGNQDVSHGTNQMGNHQNQVGSHSTPSGVSKGWGTGNQNGAAVVTGQVHKGSNPVVVLPSASHGHVSPVAGASHHGQVHHQHDEDQDDSDEQETGGQHGHQHHHDDDQESQSVRQQYGRRQY